MSESQYYEFRAVDRPLTNELSSSSGDIDEHISDDWQCIPYFAIKVMHRAPEVLGIQVRGWTNFSEDDHLFRIAKFPPSATYKYWLSPHSPCGLENLATEAAPPGTRL